MEIQILGLGPVEVDESQLQGETPEEQQAEVESSLRSKFAEVKNFVDTAFAGLSTEEKASLFTAPIPILGDAVGLWADAMQYIEEPESRTVLNGLLTTASVLPVVPNTRAAEAAPKVAENLRTWFHGTPEQFKQFKASPTFLTEDITEADRFARKAEDIGAGTGRVVRVGTDLQKPFDPERMTEADAEAIRTFFRQRMPDIDDELIEEAVVNPVRQGNWQVIEGHDFQDFLRTQGFDSFFVREPGTGARNLGVLDPQRLRQLGDLTDAERRELLEAAGGQQGEQVQQTIQEAIFRGE